MKLFGEEVDTEIAVLASLGGCGDADDLAWTSLQDQKISDANVVAWDGDGVGQAGTLGIAAALSTTWSSHGDFAVFDDNVFFTVVMVVVVVTSGDWVQDAISCAMETVAERVVVTVFVVISHIKLVLGLVYSGSSLCIDSNVLFGGGKVSLNVLAWTSRSALPVGGVILGSEWGGALTVTSLDYVYFGVTLESLVLDVDLCVNVTTVRFSVSAKKGISNHKDKPLVLECAYCSRSISMRVSRESRGL